MRQWALGGLPLRGPRAQRDVAQWARNARRGSVREGKEQALVGSDVTKTAVGPHARVRAGVSMPGALALGLFLAWQNALIFSTFPMQGDMRLLGMQAALWFASFLTTACLLRAQLAGRPAALARPSVALGAGAVTAGTLAGVAAVLLGTWGPAGYAGAVVCGAAVAVGLFVWVCPVARLDARARVGTMLAALTLANVLGLVVAIPDLGHAGVAVATVALGAAGVGALLRWSVDAGGHAVASVTYRPTSSQHYRLLMVALVLYAFVFGSVSGSTGMQATGQEAHSLALQVAQCGVVVCGVFLLAFLAARGSGGLEVAGRVLTPFLAILFLAHIVLPTEARRWLPPLTLAFWQLVEVFVILVLVDISRSGVGSLGLVFSAGWCALAGGFAAGALFGSVMSVAFGIEEEAVNAITVLHTVLAVVGSSLLAAARYPEEMPPAHAAGSAQGAADDAAIRQAAPVPATDAISDACERLSARHALSEREAEVLELLARGNTRQSIATKLVVSENTVRTHVKNIYAKLRIHSKQQLIDLVDGMRAS